MASTRGTGTVGIAIALLVAPGCRSESDAWVPGDEVALTASPIVEGEPRAVGMLQFLNHPATSLAVLDEQVKLESRAANGIIAYRSGKDGIAANADDRLFKSTAEVDAIKYVGPSTLEQLASFAESNGWVPTGAEQLGVYDDVAFTADEAAATLTLVNTASAEVLDDDVKLDARAADAIVAARPIATILALSKLSYVGPSALLKLREFAAVPSGPAIPPGSAGSDCSVKADCNAPLYCTGHPSDGSPNIGKCADTSKKIPGKGNPCSEAVPCNAELSCVGMSVMDGNGYCRPLWMTGTFESTTSIPIPDGSSTGITSGVVVYGLATVPVDIFLTLDIDHPRPQDLVVVLHAPNPSFSIVLDHASSTQGTITVLGGIERDHYVNGTYTLEVKDTVSGKAGTLRGFTLTISSQYD